MGVATKPDKVLKTNKNDCNSLKKSTFIFKLRFLLLFVIFMIMIKWVQFLYKLESNRIVVVTRSTKRKVTASSSSKYSNKSNISQKPLKFVLLWDFHSTWAPFWNKTHGQAPFIKNNCTFTNCYVTSKEDLFGGDLTKFDVLLFQGWVINTQKIKLPKLRTTHQKYVFFFLESGDNYPMCNKTYDQFFNWTMSFRLDSDIPYPYLLIRDLNGSVVGPKKNMKWIEKMHEVDESLIRQLRTKSKAAAWLVSHCDARSGRMGYIKKLQKALAAYALKVDIYGGCGTLNCSRDNNSCSELLKRDYYFYMAMENSFSSDYVTEKVLHGLKNYAVPVVYGAANYSWFLPPGSYIDARAHKPEELAARMNFLIKSKRHYYEFFRWKYHYTYHDPLFKENVCAFCAAINNKTKFGAYSSYDHFRKWWNPNFTQRCP